jgi:hypothetical protein
VFKKALKIAVSLCLLVTAYAGYTRAFSLVLYVLKLDHPDANVGFTYHEPNSARRAKELAQESFPKDHWAGGDGL